MRALTLAFGVLLLWGCANSGSDELSLPNQRAERVNSQSTATAAVSGQQLQLAVEVEVTASGVTPIGAVIIRAPQRTSSGLPDLRVTIDGSQPTAYSLADPRLAQVDAEGERVLPSARTFIHAPLSANLGSVRIEPMDPGRKDVSRGGVIDLRPLLVRACEEARELQECQAILRTVRR